jgi:hypothetical protein
VLRHNRAIIGGVILLIAAGSITIGVRRGLGAPEALREPWKTPGE